MFKCIFYEQKIRNYHTLFFFKTDDHIQPAIRAMIKNRRRSPTIMTPIMIFLFFHHIFLLTVFAVFLISYDWSAKVYDFLTKISIFYPLSMTLFIFSNACSSSSVNYFLKDENLSILAGLL